MVKFSHFIIFKGWIIIKTSTAQFKIPLNVTKLYLPIDATILPQKKNEEEKRGGQMEDKMENLVENYNYDNSIFEFREKARLEFVQKFPLENL